MEAYFTSETRLKEILNDNKQFVLMIIIVIL